MSKTEIKVFGFPNWPEHLKLKVSAVPRPDTLEEQVIKLLAFIPSADASNENVAPVLAFVRSHLNALRETIDSPLLSAAPDLLDAVKAMQTACDEWAAEFTQKKRAANWGIINEAYCKAERAIAKAEAPRTVVPKCQRD